MEALKETDELVQSAIEFEDIVLSDTEDTDNNEYDAVQLTIDGYSTLVTNGSSTYCSDMQSCERENNHCAFQSSGTDLSGDTSSEELDCSDEGASFIDSFKIKEINLDSVVCSGINRQFESSSSFNHSSTVFKQMFPTDSEYISDEEVNIFERRSMASAGNRTKHVTSGLSVAGVFASVRDFFSGKPDSLMSLNACDPFSDTIFLKNVKSEDVKSPLMTCAEFLTADHSADDDTDEEVISMDLGGVNEVHGPICCSADSNQSNGGASILEDALRRRGKGDFMAQLQNNTRRSSWTTELLSDDESVSTDIGRSKTKKRNSLTNVLKDPDECLTDEEVVDLDNKEWTETDDSGGVRQITQIKTETSIKLEDAVKSLRKIPEKEPSDFDRKSSTDSEADDLSFTEKKSYFQRLSLTSENIPGTNKYIQDVSLDDLPMAEGEIIEEKISFEDKLKMFEPDEDNRKKIQKRDKQEQPTVYRYDFTKNGKDKMDVTEFAVSELEKAEEIVKQVSEELIEEESRLNSGFTKGSIESSFDSAITLERVEQEVYSLIAEVDKEEKKLSKDDVYDSENEDAASESESQEHSLLEDVMQESKSILSKQTVEEESFSSKLKVEGDGSALDGDGLVSTTTSTTTRVVTSVISDPDGQSEFQSTFVQQLSDDDIRQSCEITVNEVLNDNTAPKPGESEHDE